VCVCVCVCVCGWLAGWLAGWLRLCLCDGPSASVRLTFLFVCALGTAATDLNASNRFDVVLRSNPNQ
jgi:hypothetical protein